MSHAPAVALRGLCRAFGGERAVDAIDLDIAEGELFCLLGASGCGKSTLLRLIAGLETPDAGTIALGGVDVTATPPWARPVNLMFQSYALFPHLSVARNVAFGLERAGLPRREITTRIEHMLALVRLEGLGARRPDQLSGGQRQRVALARALARRPRVLLLDEPLAALDRKLREATQVELLRVQRELGTTFVIVTHDQHEALSLASRIGVMARGRLLQVDTPAAVYERPVDAFVADFIGTANLLAARVVAREHDCLAVQLAAGGEHVWVAHAGAWQAGDTVRLLLRPEQLELAEEVASRGDAALNRLRGRLETLSYGGDAWRYGVSLDDATRITVSAPNTLHAGRQALAPGARVVLRWPPSCGRLLPP